MKFIHHIFTQDFTKEITKKTKIIEKKDLCVTAMKFDSSVAPDKMKGKGKKTRFFADVHKTTSHIFRSHRTDELHLCVIKFLCLRSDQNEENSYNYKKERKSDNVPQLRKL